MSAADAIVYVDGAAGVDGTYVEGDPTHPRKTLPVVGNYGTNSTTIRLSGSGRDNGIRGIRGNITKNNIVIEQWSGMPAYQLRGDTIVQTGVLFSVHSGTTYKTAFTPSVGICAVVKDYDSTTIAGYDPDNTSVTYNCGFDYTKASSLANCIATDKTWWYESNFLYIHDSALNLTVAGHYMSVCDCEGSDLLNYTGNNVSIGDLDGALCPTSSASGTNGYVVKLDTCTGLLSVTGRSDGTSRCRDTSAHVVGFLNCVGASLCYVSKLTCDGARGAATSLVWYSTSGTYGVNACVCEDITTHFRRWLKSDGTPITAENVNDVSQIIFGHDEGVYTRVPRIIASRLRAVYCTGLQSGQQEPEPIGIGTNSTLTSGGRFNRDNYQVIAYDFVAVNATTIHHSARGSVYYIRPVLHIPRLKTNFGTYGRSAFSLGLSGSLKIYRRLYAEDMQMVVDTTGTSLAQYVSVFTVSSGNASDGIILVNPSCRNIDPGGSVTNLRNWIDYSLRGDDCYEIIGGVFEHTATDPNLVYAFAAGDHSPAVGATRSILDNAYKGIATNRYSQDFNYYSFANWSTLVDSKAVAVSGTLFPFTGSSTMNLGLDSTSQLWPLKRQTSTVIPTTGLGANLRPYDGHLGANQYGIATLAGSCVGGSGMLFDED